MFEEKAIVSFNGRNMLNISVSKNTYEVADDGSRINVLEVKGSKGGNELTVTELRDYLNELITNGYGDYGVEADTQDGATYSVCDEVLVFNRSRKILMLIKTLIMLGDSKYNEWR